ncbi:hypothetical protein DAPPUDRAFT_255480 [Daphnia pulex]|uniref:Histone deacetylase domain-containing protein n=1 Tax=Daphnia pulex TaxID=6669 RepID=E9H998_DAPPU|nr:hypothetical protein DAPPUDRAFT_255480 [Daphnia pulex]|eukprot:EFX71583.1 hypothetical protein DAPPUDRAFT_255480 [Daphnia pulex]
MSLSVFLSSLLAESDNASGFCYFNNVALAANYAIEIHQLDRIHIVDWDICLVKGIQKMFEEDPRVLYISSRRLDNFPFKPETSDCSMVSTGPGTGFTVNIACPCSNF